jgi:hypothetical protein
LLPPLAAARTILLAARRHLCRCLGAVLEM